MHVSPKARRCRRENTPNQNIDRDTKAHGIYFSRHQEKTKNATPNREQPVEVLLLDVDIYTEFVIYIPRSPPREHYIVNIFKLFPQVMDTEAGTRPPIGHTSTNYTTSNAKHRSIRQQSKYIQIGRTTFGKSRIPRKRTKKNHMHTPHPCQRALSELIHIRKPRHTYWSLSLDLKNERQIFDAVKHRHSVSSLQAPCSSI